MAAAEYSGGDFVGLEIVELVMRLEEEFEIVIEDGEAEQCETCGQLYELVKRKLHDLPMCPAPATGGSLWDEVRSLIADELSVPIESVIYEAHLVRDLNLG